MSGAFEIAGIGLSAQQKALDTVASNIANINTAGYKRSDIAFAELISVSAPQSQLSSRLETVTQVAGLSASLVPQIDVHGALDTTGGALDIAVDGGGFIEILGPDGRSLLWRGGTMKVNDDGLLAASNGLPLRALISVPRDAGELAISPDGRVLAKTGSDPAPVELGQITLVRPAAASALTRLDGGYYEAGQFSTLIEALPGEDGAGLIVQGAIERSNVDLNSEMVEMMIIQRAYSANAKVIQAADEVATIINSLRR